MNTNADISALSNSFAQVGQKKSNQPNSSPIHGRGQRKISAKQQEKEFGKAQKVNDALKQDYHLLIDALINGVPFFAGGLHLQGKTNAKDAVSRLGAIAQRLESLQGLNNSDFLFLTQAYNKRGNDKHLQKYLGTKSYELNTVQRTELKKLFDEAHIQANRYKDQQEQHADDLLGMSETTQETKKPELNVSIDVAMKTLTDVIKSQQDQLDAQAQIIADLTERMNQVEELSVYAAQELQNRFTI